MTIHHLNITERDQEQDVENKSNVVDLKKRIRERREAEESELERRVIAKWTGEDE
jgi:hypothetical protein